MCVCQGVFEIFFDFFRAAPGGGWRSVPGGGCPRRLWALSRRSGAFRGVPLPFPVCPDCAILFYPHPPDPPSPAGKGENLSLLCRGLSPPAPLQLNPRGTASGNIPGAPTLYPRRGRHCLPGGLRCRKAIAPPAAYLCPAPGGGDHLRRRRRIATDSSISPPGPPRSPWLPPSRWRAETFWQQTGAVPGIPKGNGNPCRSRREFGMSQTARKADAARIRT